MAMGVKPNIKYLEKRNEVLHAFSFHDLVKKYFGKLLKNVSLEEEISKMVQWVKKHGTKETAKFKNIEIYKNLPESWQ